MCGQACYIYDIGGPRYGQVIQKLEGHTDRVSLPSVSFYTGIASLCWPMGLPALHQSSRLCLASRCTQQHFTQTRAPRSWRRPQLTRRSSSGPPRATANYSLCACLERIRPAFQWRERGEWTKDEKSKRAKERECTCNTSLNPVKS